MPNIRCNGCGKKPDQIDEYIYAADDESISPTEFVISEEGTYNPDNGHFWCTDCYVKVGMPLGRAR